MKRLEKIFTTEMTRIIYWVESFCSKWLHHMQLKHIDFSTSWDSYLQNIYI